MLKRVSIQNFKSLKDVTLDLQKVNLLIGPNNSGKTNFLKALEFVQKFGEGSDLLGDMNFTYVGKEKKTFLRIVIELEAGNKMGKPPLKHLYYALEYNNETLKNANYREFYGQSLRQINSFEISDIDNLNRNFDIYSLNVNDMSFSGFADYEDYQKHNDSLLHDTNSFYIKKNNKGISSDETQERGVLFETLRQVYTFQTRIFSEESFPFSRLTIFRPNPNVFIRPSDFSADEIELKGDCSNLIQFLFYLNTNYENLYQQIKIDLAKCVKDIVSFTTPPIKVGLESKLGLKFFDKNGNDYKAEDVSEGVLYFLALLTIINQPNPPKLLLLEEPEKGIHPRRIFEVIQFILGLAEEKDIQVVMTTHSPVVLDMFKDMTDSVFIFDKDDEGATQVKNLQRDVIEPDEEESKRLGIEPPHYTNSLGSSWTVGFLGGVPK